MNKNSLTVYFDKVLPTLSGRQTEIVRTLENLNKCTIYQAARYLGVFPNQISGRFSELIKKEVLKVVDTVQENNRPHNVYALNLQE